MPKIRKTTHVRLIVIGCTLFLSLAIFLATTASISEPRLQIIRLTQLYALTAITYLYLTLLASPLIRVFPKLPHAGMYIHARRALGLSVFYFATLHASFAFFGQLGGFAGLPFLNEKYLLAITLSSTALFILFIMAIISWDGAIQRLGFKKWKFIHRFVYLAGFLILIHALMLGTHFANLSGVIPQILFLGVSLLLFLEALRVDASLQKKFHFSSKFKIATFLTAGLTIAFHVLQFFPCMPLSLSIHQMHVQTNNRENSDTPCAFPFDARNK